MQATSVRMAKHAGSWYEKESNCFAIKGTNSPKLSILTFSRPSALLKSGKALEQLLRLMQVTPTADPLQHGLIDTCNNSKLTPKLLVLKYFCWGPRIRNTFKGVRFRV